MPFDFKQFDVKVVGAREWVTREFAGLRTGRATPSILDSVSVSAYGSLMPLKQVASISVEDPRTLRVQPYDASLIKDIERGVSSANLGLGTASDSSGLRVTFPDLTGERRQELLKLAKGKMEEAKATLRVARDDAWKKIQDLEREGKLTEDDKFTLKEELQKKMDAATDALESALAAKEKEMSA
ncbi:MAG TPA: ribosome recycling factor [Candidatus Paceibacterota bacterium]|nr:ribosome recycling factor [Candidatus Paceibacterota bacterium]